MTRSRVAWCVRSLAIHKTIEHQPKSLSHGDIATANIVPQFVKPFWKEVLFPKPRLLKPYWKGKLFLKKNWKGILFTNPLWQPFWKEYCLQILVVWSVIGRKRLSWRKFGREWKGILFTGSLLQLFVERNIVPALLEGKGLFEGNSEGKTTA